MCCLGHGFSHNNRTVTETEFKVCLDSKVILRPAWACVDYCSQYDLSQKSNKEKAF